MSDPAQAEEVAQEVLLEIWRTAFRYDSSKGSAAAWALTIARRRAIDRIRANAAMSARELRTAPGAASWDQVFALLVAALVGSGLAARLRDQAQSRNPKAAAAGKPPNPDGRPGIEQLPGFAKLPARAQTALQSESPWVAWVAGLAVGMPTAYYLAAIAAILKSGAGVGPQVGALLVFNVVAFVLAEIPMVSFLAAPEATRTRVDQLYDWMNAHHRLVIATLAGVVGVYLLIIGISKL